LRISLIRQMVFSSTSSEQYILGVSVTKYIYMTEKSAEGIRKRTGLRVATEGTGAIWSTSQGGTVGAPKAMDYVSIRNTVNSSCCQSAGRIAMPI
jgi:hypothetical protein